MDRHGAYPLILERPPAPLVAELAARLEGDERAERRRRGLLDAPEVLVHAASMGLGDCIGELRYAFAAARALPAKRFTILAHPAVAGLTILDVPPNAALRTAPPTLPAGQKDAFWMTCNYCLDVAQVWSHWKHRFNLAWDPRPLASLMETRREEGRAGSAVDVFGMAEELPVVSDIRRRPIEDPPSYNAWDALCMLHHRSLGIGCGDEDDERSLLRAHSTHAPAVDDALDIVLAPDAWGSVLDDPNRSYKSVSVEKWGAVFGALPRELSVGVIIGIAHPRYCEAVFRAGRSVHARTTRIVAPTLSAFAAAVAGARKFVGSDSGTSHIAAELARAGALSAGVRVVFNSEVANPAVHGVRGLGERGRMLVYRAQDRRTGHLPRRDYDVSNVPTAQLTEFVLS